MKIAFVGDVNLGEYYTSFGNGPGSYAKSHYIFESVEDIFSESDFVVGNLEAAICDVGLEERSFKSKVLRVDPASATQFESAGFKVLQVANNHAIQHGLAAFDQCLDILKELSIKPVGLQDQDLVVVEDEEVSIGFLAASDVPDNTFKDQQVYQRINEDFFEKVKESVDKVDHLVVMLHWGLEESTAPMEYQRRIADKLDQLGVSALIGSHPHLFYEVVKLTRLVCAYSLGNFVFDLSWDKRLLQSGILEINFTKKETSARVWPVSILENGCKPVPFDNAIQLKDKITLYDNGKSMAYQPIKKLFYFFANIFRGDTKLKLSFFKDKILK